MASDTLASHLSSWRRITLWLSDQSVSQSEQDLIDKLASKDAELFDAKHENDKLQSMNAIQEIEIGKLRMCCERNRLRVEAEHGGFLRQLADITAGAKQREY